MGVMEHIEPAGIHSGDSNAVLPAFNLTPMEVTTMEFYSEKLPGRWISGFDQHTVCDQRRYRIC